jgi:hypothetical protein
MATFAYHFPGLTGEYAQADDLPGGLLDRCGLERILDGASIETHSGQPAGLPAGLTIIVQPTHGSTGKPIDIAGAGEIVWTERAGEDDQITHYVGHDPNHHPRPADLARPRHVRGIPCTLRDGAEWLIPIIHWQRGSEIETTLPKILHVDRQGNPTLKRTPEYADVCETARRIFDATITGESWPFSELDTMKFNADLLSVNYRIGVMETAILELLDSASMMDPILIAVASVALEQEHAAQKKTGVIAATGTTAPCGVED